MLPFLCFYERTKRNMNSLLASFRRLWWPFWDVWYNLKFYLDSTFVIREGLHNSRSIVKEEAKNRKVNQIRFLLLLLSTRCVQLILICLVDISHFWKMLHHDYMLYLGCAKEINTLPMLFGFQTIVFGYRMYWLNYGKAFQPIFIVRQVLFHSWNECFAHKRIARKFGCMPVSELILHYTAQYLTFLKYFYAIIGKALFPCEHSLSFCLSSLLRLSVGVLQLATVLLHLPELPFLCGELSNWSAKFALCSGQQCVE